MGIVCPTAKRNDIISGADGGKKLSVTGIAAFGSRTAMNQTIIGAASINQTGNNKLCASFNSPTEAPIARKIEL